jgi:V/A-type H+-transporting ATPase subunit I
MSGWVAREDFDRFVSAIDVIGDIKYIVENPHQLKIAVPTKMKNPALLRPFESFIRMYGVPRYDEMDPTPLVAVSYLLFFGLMFGDLGQGAVILLVGAFLWFFKKLHFGKILMSCGFSSMMFGLVYDSVFGYEGTINRLIFGNEEIEIGYSPSHNLMQTLLIAVAIGVAFIILVMLLNIINGLRQKNIEKALFSQNGVAGLVLYSAGIYLAVKMLLLGGGKVSAAYTVGFFAVPLVIIFFRRPLAYLVTGGKRHYPESISIGEFIIENFFELFDDLLSFITNTVSFVRIGAFALSHAGMMFVVFLLANTTATAGFGSGNLAVVIFGNILIMGLEGLVVGIQGLRLEFYELFSRFYSGDGVDFIPAQVDNSK